MIYDILYETLIDPKLLRFRFDLIDRFIRFYDGTRYWTLFGLEKYEPFTTELDIFQVKKVPPHIFFSHYFTKIKVDSYNALPIQKILTLHNATIDIKSVLNKDKNGYYYKTFLEKWSYQSVEKQLQIFVHSLIMVRFKETEIAKENLLQENL